MLPLIQVTVIRDKSDPNSEVNMIMLNPWYIKRVVAIDDGSKAKSLITTTDACYSVQETTAVFYVMACDN